MPVDRFVPRVSIGNSGHSRRKSRQKSCIARRTSSAFSGAKSQPSKIAPVAPQVSMPKPKPFESQM